MPNCLCAKCALILPRLLSTLPVSVVTHSSCGQLLFVVGIKRDNDEIVAEQGQYFRIGPHPRFHFAAVDATVPRVVDEQRLVYFTGVGHRFVIVEETLQSVRQA